jgi:CheY-like chemotaxis protein
MTSSDSHYVSHYSMPMNLVLVEDGDGDEKVVRGLRQKAQGATTPFASYHVRPVNIVLVEDDDGDAKAVRRAFQKAKIANPFIRAVDGLDALDILRGANGKAKVPAPYLLLVDLNMPRMGGIQLIRALRADEQLRQSIAFILTTSSSDDDKEAAYDLHVAGYIVKATAGQDFLNLADLVDCYWRIVELPTHVG